VDKFGKAELRSDAKPTIFTTDPGPVFSGRSNNNSIEGELSSFIYIKGCFEMNLIIPTDAK